MCADLVLIAVIFEKCKNEKKKKKENKWKSCLCKQNNSKVHSARTLTPVQRHTQTVAQTTECCSVFTDSVKVPWLPWDEQALEESRASG